MSGDVRNYTSRGPSAPWWDRDRQEYRPGSEPRPGTLTVVIPGRDSTTDLARYCESAPARAWGDKDHNRPMTPKEWAAFGKAKRHPKTPTTNARCCATHGGYGTATRTWML